VVVFSVGGMGHRLYEEGGKDADISDAYRAEEIGLVRLLHALIHLALVVYRGRDSITSR